MQKPKLQMAPPKELIKSQQEDVEKLLKLDQWTEEPLEGAQSAPEAKPKAPPQPRPKKAVAVPQKPWDGVSEDATHPYHVILPKVLFLKLDYVWKRGDYKSAREFVIKELDALLAKKLKDLS